MIAQELTKLKITEEEAKKTLVYKAENYDKVKKEFTFTKNNATGKAFRLVHDGTKAFIIEGTTENITTTIHAVEEFVTEQEALDRIKVLGLEYEEPG